MSPHIDKEAAALWIDKSPYWLTREAVAKVEALRQARFMGHWCTKGPRGGWNESPVDVFYQSRPDVEKGHKHYFGLLRHNGQLFICDATSAFSEPITGVLATDGEVVVSRFRHDYQERKGVMIDGGRDYLKTSSSVSLVLVTVKAGEFVFTHAEM